MAKEVARSSQPVENLRAADHDRQQIAEQLKAALDEGRLSLHEYDDRLKDAYAAQTYSQLLVLVADLPAPGLSADEVKARRAAEKRREDRRMPMALTVLWIIFATIAVVNVMVWGIVDATVGGGVYPWPIWLLVPGSALAAVTYGVQRIRRR